MGSHSMHSPHYAFILNAPFTLICVSADTCSLNKLMSGIYTRDWIGIFYSDWSYHIWNRQTDIPHSVSTWLGTLVNIEVLFTLLRCNIIAPTQQKRAMAQSIVLEGIIPWFLFRFHELRHIFATLVLSNGVDMKTVSGILEHYSAWFAPDTYAHVTTSAQSQAAETRARILSSSL